MLSLVRSGGVFYGGLIAAVAVGVLVHAAAPAAAVDDGRRVRARHRARPRHRPARLPLRRAAASAGPPTCRGRSRSTSPIAARTSARRSDMPLHPTQLYEAGAELLILGLPARDRTARAGRSPDGRSGATCCSTAISRFIIEFYRGDERGIVSARCRRRSSSRCILVPLSIVMLVSSAGATPARRRRRPARRAMRRCADRLTPRDVLVVDDDHDGLRLDSFLTAILPDQSRSQIQRLIKDGHVTRAGAAGASQHRRPRRASASTSTSRSRGRRRRSRRRCRCASCIEDADVVVLDKPAGMVVHPGRRPCERHARQRAAAPRQGSERRRRRAAAGHRAPARSRHVGPDGGREERRGAPGAGAAVSAIAKSRRNTSRSSGASCSRDGGSTRRSAAIRTTGRRCRPARAARAAR